MSHGASQLWTSQHSGAPSRHGWWPLYWTGSFSILSMVLLTLSPFWAVGHGEHVKPLGILIRPFSNYWYDFHSEEMLFRKYLEP